MHRLLAISAWFFVLLLILRMKSRFLKTRSDCIPKTNLKSFLKGKITVIFSCFFSSWMILEVGTWCMIPNRYSLLDILYRTQPKLFFVRMAWPIWTNPNIICIGCTVFYLQNFYLLTIYLKNIYLFHFYPRKFLSLKFLSPDLFYLFNIYL